MDIGRVFEATVFQVEHFGLVAVLFVQEVDVVDREIHDCDVRFEIFKLF